MANSPSRLREFMTVRRFRYSLRRYLKRRATQTKYNKLGPSTFIRRQNHKMRKLFTDFLHFNISAKEESQVLFWYCNGHEIVFALLKPLRVLRRWQFGRQRFTKDCRVGCVWMKDDASRIRATVNNERNYNLIILPLKYQVIPRWDMEAWRAERRAHYNMKRRQNLPALKVAAKRGAGRRRCQTSWLEWSCCDVLENALPIKSILTLNRSRTHS